MFDFAIEFLLFDMKECIYFDFYSLRNKFLFAPLYIHISKHCEAISNIAVFHIICFYCNQLSDPYDSLFSSIVVFV